MADFKNPKSRSAFPKSGASVDALAARVISVLTNRSEKMSSPENDAIHDALRDAVLHRGIFDVQTVLKVLRDMRARDVDLVDIFIPDVARDLGNGWEASTLSFSQVSIGSARLQSLIPHLEMTQLTMDPAARMRADTNMLLIVCPNEDHTLGSLIFASQLRRMGYSVRLSLGQSLETLRKNENLAEFELILFSCSYTGALETVAKIVQFVRTFGSRRPKTVLGGPVLDHVDDLKKRTGVDLVTNDLTVALRELATSPADYRKEKAAE